MTTPTADPSACVTFLVTVPIRLLQNPAVFFQFQCWAEHPPNTPSSQQLNQGKGWVVLNLNKSNFSLCPNKKNTCYGFFSLNDNSFNYVTALRMALIVNKITKYRYSFDRFSKHVTYPSNKLGLIPITLLAPDDLLEHWDFSVEKDIRVSKPQIGRVRISRPFAPFQQVDLSKPALLGEIKMSRDFLLETKFSLSLSLVPVINGKIHPSQPAPGNDLKASRFSYYPHSNEMVKTFKVVSETLNSPLLEAVNLCLTIEKKQSPCGKTTHQIYHRISAEKLGENLSLRYSESATGKPEITFAPPYDQIDIPPPPPFLPLPPPFLP